MGTKGGKLSMTLFNVFSKCEVKKIIILELCSTVESYLNFIDL